jgi:hypothetical protein
MAPHQQLLLIPGLFGDRNHSRSGNQSRQSERLLAKLEDYWRWLSADPHVRSAATSQSIAVAGMLAWHFEDLPQSFGSIYSSIYGLGFESFPEVVSRLSDFKTLAR